MTPFRRSLTPFRARHDNLTRRRREMCGGFESAIAWAVGMAKADVQRIETPDATPQAGPEGRAAVSSPQSSNIGPSRALYQIPSPVIKGANRWLRRDARFLLLVFACGVISLLLLSIGSGALQTRTNGRAGQARATPGAQTASPAATSNVIAVASHVVPAHERVFALPAANAGLMQPAVDGHGNVWFGEMGTNKLARLDAHTGDVSEWQPPNGRYNIMETAVDAQGAIWFTEQAANYIGRFTPDTQQFTTYPLETVNGHGSAPQDLVIDGAGKVWFTEVTGGKIGKLDPNTGKISTWPVPSPDKGPAYPFSLTLADGGQVWFGYLSGGALGTLDPSTGAVKIVRLRDPQAQVFGVTADAKGRIWFTELEQGNVGWVDTASGRVTEIAVPQKLGTNAGLYGVAAAKDGSIWFASSGENALLRYDPGAATLTFYQLGRDASAPFGLALENDGTLWFTADSNPNNYVGAIKP